MTNSTGRLKWKWRLAALIGSLGLAGAAGAEGVDYLRDIKPLLAKRCYSCHAAETTESGLRLDTAAAILKGGVRGPAVAPGKAAESLLLQAVRGEDPDLRMPPEGPLLAAAEVERLRAWIDAGATSPAGETAHSDPRSTHWAFQPLRQTQPPPVEDGAWIRNAIDFFILASLERRRVPPSPEADRATLIRRLSLDLTGLPPTPEAVEAFERDERPDAYERRVDAILASPGFGERWGRHWLDVARYGDSNGYTIDSPRSIWLYRDWVINAWNRNLPFNQFVVEQLAGDLLPDSTEEQRIATGFHRNTLTNEEGGTDPEQFRVERVVDRVNTTGSAFLGLTVGCSQCHDHKYDPLSQRDYYQLFAFFNSTSEPTLSRLDDAARQSLERLNEQIQSVEAELAAVDAREQPEWERRVAASGPQTWETLAPLEPRASSGAAIKLLPDHSLLVSADGDGQHDHYTLAAELPERLKTQPITAFRLEVLTHPDLPSRGPGLAANGNFVLGRFAAEFTGAGSPTTAAAFRRATADFSQAAFVVAGVIDQDPKTGWGIYGGTGKNHTAIFELESPLPASATSPASEKLAAGETRRLSFRLEHEAYNPSYKIGRFRLSATASPTDAWQVDDKARAALQTSPEQRTPEQRQAITAAYRAAAAVRQPLQTRLDQLKQQRAAINKAVPTTLVLAELPQPRPTFIHIRGDFLRPGAAVAPDVPAVLPPLPRRARSTPPNRLDLAEWLVAPQNPLTARVSVNRFWQRLFGRGLVETENDFGLQGAAPSHPELLDYLAREWMESGWNTKDLLRRIVTSSVYRQSSQIRSELLQDDPKNQWLARQSRLRLEAETVRDAALAAGDQLCRQLGGPSVFPPQPDGVDAFTQARKNWKASQGGDRYRRGMYTHFWRSNPHPFLMTFDAPDANTSCTRRARSNTPLQALTLANDVVFVEAAQALAERTLARPGDDSERLQRLMQRCLSRSPDGREMRILQETLRQQREEFTADADGAELLAPAARRGASEAAEFAAWTAVARVLLNLDECITRE